jgi:hypothetical protein
MNKKAIILSVLAGGLIVLASLSSVVGTHSLTSIDKNNATSSPLFTVRSQQFINKDISQAISTNYLGKGKQLTFQFLEKTSFNKVIGKALKIIEAKPHIFYALIEKITSFPQFSNLLAAYDLTIDDFKNYLHQVIEEPHILKEKIDEVAVDASLKDDPLPLGLSTSNPIGCLIIAIVVIPIFALIGAIIATMTILTCFFPGCFEEFVGNFLDGIIQGLIQPGY